MSNKNTNTINRPTKLGRPPIHGETHTSEYQAYRNARQRCNDCRHHAYHQYGQRGIKFRFTSYQHFINSLGKKPGSKYSLDRIDNEGHYEPNNCRWATVKEQGQNRRTSRPITIGTETKMISEWANSDTKMMWRIYNRIQRGWCSPCAVLRPINTHCSHIWQPKNIPKTIP